MMTALNAAHSRDSLARLARRDSARLAESTSVITTLLPAPPATTRAPSTTTATLSISAPESAVLYVDGKKVGEGDWTGEHAAPASLKLSAVIASASTACASAQVDTVIQLRAGSSAKIMLPVRPCVPLRIIFTPRDARVVFTPLDGGRALTTRADTVGSLYLTVGRYFVTVSAPRCAMYSDTLQTTKDAKNGLLTL